MTRFKRYINPQFASAAVLLFGFSAAMLLQPAKATENSDDTEPDSDRYELSRDGDDFIRLDKRSGQMSICRKQSGQLICRMAADDREAIEEEFDSLLERLDRLEARLDGQDDSDGERHIYRWDDEDMDAIEQELDEALDFSARFLKRFHGKMKDWRHEFRDLYKD